MVSKKIDISMTDEEREVLYQILQQWVNTQNWLRPIIPAEQNISQTQIDFAAMLMSEIEKLR